MPWRRYQRAFTAAFLAAYALASTCAGLWHDHGPSANEHDCVTGHACDAHALAAGPAHDHDFDGLSPCDHDGDQHDYDSCAVCRFLGLSSLGAQPVELLDGGQLALSMGDRPPRHSSLPLLGIQHSRAPPALV